MKITKKAPKKVRYTLIVNQHELDILAALVGQTNGFPVQTQRMYDAMDNAGAKGFRYRVLTDDGEEVSTLTLKERA